MNEFIIKHRAWDEGNKIMHYDFQFVVSGHGNDWICFTSDKHPMVIAKDKNQNPSEGIFFNNPFFRQQLKVMPYTNINDVYGKEVYQSDLIQLNPNVKYYREVIWNRDGWYLWDGRTEAFGIGCIGTSHPNAICIGNIYQKPDWFEENLKIAK